MITNGYQQYREQRVLTAGPGELVLLLYDGCLREIRSADLAFRQEDAIAAGQHLVRAQAMLDQLVSGLDFEVDMAQELLALYQYMEWELRLANLDRDPVRAQNVAVMVADFRNTWAEAMRSAQQQHQPMASTRT